MVITIGFGGCYHIFMQCMCLYPCKPYCNKLQKFNIIDIKRNKLDVIVGLHYAKFEGVCNDKIVILGGW